MLTKLIEERQHAVAVAVVDVDYETEVRQLLGELHEIVQSLVVAAEEQQQIVVLLAGKLVQLERKIVVHAAVGMALAVAGIGLKIGYPIAVDAIGCSTVAASLDH